MKLFNAIFSFKDFTYILQLEEYASSRFLKWLPRFFFRRNVSVREKLVYTFRAKVTLTLSFFIWAACTICAFLFFNFTPAFILAVCLLIFIPFIVLTANLLLIPFFNFAKLRLRNRARVIISKQAKLKIIAVAGSFGKTTTKNFIEQFVRYSFATQMIPGNINTPSGIANWIIKNLKTTTQLLIVEMDTYEIGEIRKSAQVASPDIAVITNVGDQHIERHGSQENLAKALAELFVFSKKEAVLIASRETFEKIGRKDFGSRRLNEVDISRPIYMGEVISANVSGSNIANLCYALEVASILNVSKEFILDTLPKLDLPDRRQKPGNIYGYEALDDSYNISFTTAKAGLELAKTLADKSGKKLLTITGGIPELGAKDKDKNKILGEILADKSDHVVVLGNIFAKEISLGAKDKSKITIAKNLVEFKNEHAKKFPQNEWFLFHMPELGDLYY